MDANLKLHSLRKLQLTPPIITAAVGSNLIQPFAFEAMSPLEFTVSNPAGLELIGGL